MPVLAVMLLFAVPASANCVLPAAPSRIPDGNSATEQEMVAAMHTLKQYNDDVTEYTQCLEFERRLNHIGFDAGEKLRAVALTTLATVADRFNEQVRRFKARRS